MKMANKFYTPIEASPDNAGLIKGLADLRLAAEQQRYNLEDQINKGLMSPNKVERDFWIGEAKKAGILKDDYAEASDMQSPLRNVQKVAQETQRLTDMKKNKWTADSGETNFNDNMKKAGLMMNKKGDKYLNARTGKEVDEYTANQLIDSAAGRGNRRQTSGNETVEGFGDKSAAQKLYEAQKTPGADVSQEKADVETAGGNGKIMYEDTARGKADAAETAKQADAKAYDDVTAYSIYDAAGKMTTNPQERYGLAQSWIEDNIKDPRKAQMLKEQIMRFPEQQKYTGMRGADRGLDEAKAMHALKPQREAYGRGEKKDRKVLVSADGGLSGTEIYVPENTSLQDFARYRKHEYIKSMETAIGSKDNKWWPVLQLAKKQDEEYQRSGGKRGVELWNNPTLTEFHKMFQDKPNAGQMDTTSRLDREAAISRDAEAIMKNNPGISVNDAITKAAEMNPEMEVVTEKHWYGDKKKVIPKRKGGGL